VKRFDSRFRSKIFIRNVLVPTFVALAVHTHFQSNHYLLGSAVEEGRKKRRRGQFRCRLLGAMTH
jgi:hypothetical protein